MNQRTLTTIPKLILILNMNPMPAQPGKLGVVANRGIDILTYGIL
jgi:hypothetical protein